MNPCTLSIAKLLLRGHVRIRVWIEVKVEPAFLGSSGHDDLALSAASYYRCQRVKSQPALLFERTMALNTLYIEERLHLIGPERSRVHPADIADNGQTKQECQGNPRVHGSTRSFFTGITETDNMPFEWVCGPNVMTYLPKGISFGRCHITSCCSFSLEIVGGDPSADK